jgi:radical SAM superfamily enzyme YgiQ (UPF0313 family)
MRILLANINYPHIYAEKTKNILSFFGIEKTSPLYVQSINFQILSALTPQKYKLDIREGYRFQDIKKSIDYDLIGLSCTTQYAIEAYKIADTLREYGKKVVLGGWHPSALPKEAKQHADSVFIGEAEETWLQLLTDLKNKKLKPFYKSERPVDPKKIPILKNYIKKGPKGVMATRGCPAGCDFCSITNTEYRNIFRPRPIKNVLEEIKSINGKYIIFRDNSLTINTKYTKRLFKELKNSGKHFVASGNINVLGRDQEFLELGRKAGFIGWFIGFESFSTQSLNEVGKVTNRVGEYKSNVKKIHDYDMHVIGSFIFGFDSDTKQTFNDALEHIQSIEIDIPYINILTPYPGTPLFNKLEKECRILTKDWSKYTQTDVVFQPKNMTPEELFYYTQELHDKLYTYPQILKRIIKSLQQNYLSMPILRMNNIYKNNFKYKI